MSLQELPAFSLPMKAERSRQKERMEASLAGLCELELLKQRQESRVLSALCLGDSPVPRRPPWGALRSPRCDLDAPKGSASEEHGLQTISVQWMPWCPEACLQQQVAELKVSTEVNSADPPTDLEDGRLSSGEVLEAKQDKTLETNYHTLVPLVSDPDWTGETETGEKWLSDITRQATVTDAFGEMRNLDPSQEDNQQAQKLETYIFRLIQRSAIPTRLSKPRTSLTHDIRTISVVRQSSLCHKEEQHSPKQGPVQEISGSSQCSEGTNLKPNPQAHQTLDQEQYLGLRFIGDSPMLYHHHLQKSVQYQSGLHHMQATMINSSCSTSWDYPSFRALPGHLDSSNCEPDSPQHFHNHPSPPALSKPHQISSPDEQLVNAEYIPALPCRASSRAHVHAHSTQKGSGLPKPNRSTYSPERGHHLQEQQHTASQVQTSRSRGASKKSRLNEDKCGASRKQGKRACRSQSENCLQRVPERKYNTADRDCGGSGTGGIGSHSIQSRNKKQQQGGSSYRRWQSTMELSQDEADQSAMKGSSASNQKDNCGRRPRKSRPTRASYAHPHHHSQHHQHMEYQLERVPVQPYQPCEVYPQPGQGESESSMSEADSPESSSLSSDSDESGGLVWPQQLPPQLSLPSTSAPPGAPLQPKAFVKIKASQALKKKILRFHSGSLKVMTTV